MTIPLWLAYLIIVYVLGFWCISDMQTGPNKTDEFVAGLMLILSPIIVPIALFLDLCNF